MEGYQLIDFSHNYHRDTLYLSLILKNRKAWKNIEKHIDLKVVKNSKEHCDILDYYDDRLQKVFKTPHVLYRFNKLRA